MATIREVAREAGCSIATVSRVINKQGKYSSETEERVKAVVEQLGYRTNITAKRLKRGTTMTVGLVTSEYRLLNHPALTSTSVKLLQASEFNVEIVFGKPLNQCIALLDEGRFDGLIIIDSARDERALKQLTDSKYRFVLLGVDTDREDVNRVEIDYFTGGYKATEYLIRNGHSEILLLEDNQPVSVSEEIRRGYLFALDENGISYRGSLICTKNVGEYTGQEQFGYAALKESLREERFSAVFATDDRIACGAVRALSESKLCVPDQCSVIGFGNLYLSEYMLPPLTTVAVPLSEMAELGTEILLNSITRHDSAVKSVTLKPQLVVRKTVSKRLT
jgi:LacI family transcriptional regulator